MGSRDHGVAKRQTRLSDLHFPFFFTVLLAKAQIMSKFHTKKYDVTLPFKIYFKSAVVFQKVKQNSYGTQQFHFWICIQNI